MREAGEQHITPPASGKPHTERGSETRQSGRGDVRTAEGDPARPPEPGGVARRATAPIFACIRVLLTIAVRVCFRRVRIRGREHLPARGAAVLVANHPAAWTDVVVLDVAFGRRLHFLAHEPLFHPWPRGLLLRVFGSLPVFFRHETVDGLERNRETFAHCHALLAAGEVVAVFPEGVSDDDRTLRPLKTGAAHMLLEAPVSAPPAIPVAIRYENRVAFRADLTVVAGEPIAARPFRRRAIEGAGVDEAAHALTGKMAGALEAALADAASLVAADPPAPAPAGRAPALAAAGAAGRLLHAPALFAIEAAARRWLGAPQQLMLGRIAAGLVLVPAWYLVLAVAAVAWHAGPWLPSLALVPALGWIACLDYDRRTQRAAARGLRKETR